MLRAFNPLSNVIAAAFCFAIYSAIGVGPCLTLFRGSEQVLAAFCLSAPSGYALTVLAGSCLVSLDLPVSHWSFEWLFAALFVSALLIIIQHKKKNLYLSCKSHHRELLYASIGMVITFAIVMIPVLSGGLVFTTMRGNVVDAFEYADLAYMLDHDKVSWLSHAKFQELLDRNFIYAYSLNPNMFAWGVCVPLAWSARIMQLPICPFDYSYTSMLSVFAFGPILLLARSYGLGIRVSLLTALGLTCGFYSQFILDMRSLSQISTMPLTLSLAFILIALQNNAVESKRFPQSEFCLCAIFWTVIFLIYIQIIFFLTLSIAIFLGWLFLTKRLSGRILLVYISTYVASLLIAAEIQPMAFIFKRIVGLAISKNFNDQLLGNYKWLFESPVSSLWGFYLYRINPGLESLLTSGGLELLLFAIGSLLTVLLCISLYFAFISNRLPVAGLLLASFTLAEIIQFSFLYVIGKPYSAARGLTYCFPFFMLNAVAFGLWLVSHTLSNPVGLRARAVKGLVIFFVISQVFLGPYRIICVEEERIDLISAYPYQSPYNDWEMSKICDELKLRGAHTVGVVNAGNWMTHYLGIVMDPDIHVVAIDGIQNQVTLETGFQAYAAPELLITSSRYWNNRSNTMTNNPGLSRIIASNTENILLELPKDFWDRPLIWTALNNDPRPNPNYIGMNFFVKGGLSSISVPEVQAGTHTVFLGQGPQTSLCFNSTRKAQMVIILNCKSHIQNQVLTVRIDGKECGVFKLPEMLKAYEFSVPISVDAGSHDLDVHYESWDNEQSRAAVLFNDFRLMENPTKQ